MSSVILLRPNLAISVLNLPTAFVVLEGRWKPYIFGLRMPPGSVAAALTSIPENFCPTAIFCAWRET
jgi:hypothetical protein